MSYISLGWGGGGGARDRVVTNMGKTNSIHVEVSAYLFLPCAGVHLVSGVGCILIFCNDTICFHLLSPEK